MRKDFKMKIKREIDGRVYEFELTADEIRRAWQFTEVVNHKLTVVEYIADDDETELRTKELLFSHLSEITEDYVRELEQADPSNTCVRSVGEHWKKAVKEGKV